MAVVLNAGDLRLRHWIYETFATLGRAPTFDEAGEVAHSPAAAIDSLARLHAAHALVLADDRSCIRMALPFSANDVGYTVAGDDGRWWANCAWDSLAIPLSLGVDATIDASWMDDGSAVDLAVTGGELSSYEGFVHYTTPARHWWDDIGET